MVYKFPTNLKKQMRVQAWLCACMTVCNRGWIGCACTCACNRQTISANGRRTYLPPIPQLQTLLYPFRCQRVVLVQKSRQIPIILRLVPRGQPVPYKVDRLVDLCTASIFDAAQHQVWVAVLVIGRHSVPTFQPGFRKRKVLRLGP